jgi:hypothetical protein
MVEERTYGSVEDISDMAAEVSERGFLLMFRNLLPVDGDEAFEGVPARFRAVNGNPLARLRIGEEVYLFRIDDLESAFSNPCPSDQGERSGVEALNQPTREECLRAQGGLQMAREVREMQDEELFELSPGRLLAGDSGFWELRLREERFLFDPDDFWDALTDPATFRSEDYGSEPVDVLRDPIEPDRLEQVHEFVAGDA